MSSQQLTPIHNKINLLRSRITFLEKSIPNNNSTKTTNQEIIQINNRISRLEELFKGKNGSTNNEKRVESDNLVLEKQLLLITEKISNLESFHRNSQKYFPVNDERINMINQRIEQLEKNTIRLIYYIETEWKKVDIPTNAKILLISMVGGGGAGSINGGEGGCSGEIITRYPILLESLGHTSNSTSYLNMKCGSGGNSTDPNGSPSIVELFINTSVYPEKNDRKSSLTIQAKGGPSGQSKTDFTMISEKVGKDGDSCNFGKGGRGGSTYYTTIGDKRILQTRGEDGNFGAGGGSSIAEFNGNGGNGMILIEYE